MPTFASLYSGIGGADAGFAHAGWAVVWQCEIDPYRRAVIANRFGVPVFESVEQVAASPNLVTGKWPRVDLLYTELPDHRLDYWWRLAARAVAAAVPDWLIVEMSPTVPCEPVLLDLVRTGWSVRMLHVRFVIAAPSGSAPEDDDVRNRAFVIAARDAAALARIRMASNLADIVVTGQPQAERLSVAWHEESRGFKDGWICGCSAAIDDRSTCVCVTADRIAALADATSPILGRWLEARRGRTVVGRRDARHDEGRREAVMVIFLLSFIGFVTIVLAARAFGQSQGRIARRYRRRRDELLSGRQQIRAAAREMAATAVRGAPTDRRTRRRAAREIARSVRG